MEEKFKLAGKLIVCLINQILNLMVFAYAVLEFWTIFQILRKHESQFELGFAHRKFVMLLVFNW